MTKREKNIRAVAKAINRAHGISMKQCLELARLYLATHNLELPEEVRYSYDFTLPLWGKRIGDRIYPQDAATQTQCEDANRNAVLNRTVSEYGNDEIRWPDGLQHY